MATRQVLNRGELNKLLHSPTGGVARDVVRRTIKVQNQARRSCPVDTGRLRSSITHELAMISYRGHRVPAGRVGTNVQYAIYVHEGTRYISARPFLLNALKAAA